MILYICFHIVYNHSDEPRGVPAYQHFLTKKRDPIIFFFSFSWILSVSHFFDRCERFPKKFRYSRLRGSQTLARVSDHSDEPHGVPAYQHFLTKKRDLLLVSLFFGGGRWIRTTEVTDNRFTVCPLWPLGNAPPYKIRSRNYGFVWSW